MDLSSYDNANFDRGKPAIIELLWIIVQAIFVSSQIPGTWHRKRLLSLFGAKIAEDVVLKPGLKVKFPWRLEIGQNSWIGENVWIDNLALVKVGNNCCVSQGVYLCTGNHNWSDKHFTLQIGGITLDDAVWVAAQASVGPNVHLYEGAILTMGSSLYENAEKLGIYCGVPAKYVKKRKLNYE